MFELVWAVSTSGFDLQCLELSLLQEVHKISRMHSKIA